MVIKISEYNRIQSNEAPSIKKLLETFELLIEILSKEEQIVIYNFIVTMLYGNYVHTLAIKNGVKEG